MTNTQSSIHEFLNLYKELEMILRTNGNIKTVLQLEEQLSADSKDRLRICRQIRNYIQHHDDGYEFLYATEKMKSFLHQLINEIKEGKSLKIRYINPVHFSDRLADIKTLFSKCNQTWLPVVDQEEKVIGIVEMFPFIRISSSHGSHTRLSTIVTHSDLQSSSIAILKQGEELDEFEGTDGVVIGDDAKYMGIVQT